MRYLPQCMDDLLIAIFFTINYYINNNYKFNGYLNFVTKMLENM